MHIIATPPAGAPVPRIGIPRPKYPVGTCVDLNQVASYNRAFLLKRVRETVIRRLRAPLNRMQAQGHFPEMKGKKMLDCHKAQLREIFNFMHTADSVVVAGHAPWGLQSLGNIANQCYLAGGSGFGAMNYGYYFMFRKNVDGKELVYTFPEALLDETSVKFCVLPEQAAA